MTLRSVAMIALLALLAGGSPAAAAADGQTCRGTRLALAIGNAGYAGLPDGGETESAKAVAAELEHLGFSTMLAEDLDGPGLRRAVDALARKATPDSVVFLFFAGVALAADGHGYLMPTGVEITSEKDVAQRGIGVDRIVSDLTARGARLKVMVVDGARRNPFEDRFRPGTPAGLPPLAGSPGTLALYSSLPGTSFADDPDRRTAFAQALVAAMDRPDAMAEEAIRRAKAGAERAFQGSRTPWVSSFLDEDIPLSAKGCPSPQQAEAKPSPAVVAAQPAPVPQRTAQAPAPAVVPTPPPAASPAPAPPPVSAKPPAPVASVEASPTAVAPPPSHEAVVEQPPPPAPSPVASPPPPPPIPPAAVTPAEPVAPQAPARVEAPPPDDTVTDQEHLKEIADRLFDQGYDPGPPDAPGLAPAIRGYQERVSLPVDGRASVGLLESLRSVTPPSKWGAIAFGPKVGKWGMAWDVRSRRDAVAQADARCGGVGCTAVASFHDAGCGALSISTRTFSIAWKDGLNGAREDATTKCNRQGGGCHVLASVCADGTGRAQVMTNDPQAR